MCDDLIKSSFVQSALVVKIIIYMSVVFQKLTSNKPTYLTLSNLKVLLCDFQLYKLQTNRIAAVTTVENKTLEKDLQVTFRCTSLPVVSSRSVFRIFMVTFSH